jgi:hypothetical protein
MRARRNDAAACTLALGRRGLQDNEHDEREELLYTDSPNIELPHRGETVRLLPMCYLFADRRQEASRNWRFC